MQEDHGHGLRRAARRGGVPAGRALALHRQHRVLEARVVELHHVRAGRALAVEAPREVDVHDVEAARAEPEVERLDVDDDLVARARSGPTSADVGLAPAGARRRPRPRGRWNGGVRRRLRTVATVPRAQLQHRGARVERGRAPRRASPRALHGSRARSARGCARCRWRGSRTGSRAASNALASRAAAGGDVRAARSRTRRSAASAACTAGSDGAHAVAREERAATVDVDVALGRVGAVVDVVDHLGDQRLGALGVEAARPRPRRRQRSGTTLIDAARPRSCRRWRWSRRRGGRAASPRSPSPRRRSRCARPRGGCRRARRRRGTSASTAVVGRRGDDRSRRSAWRGRRRSRSAAQAPRRRTPWRPRGAFSSQTVNSSSIAHRRAARAARGAPPPASPPPPPCCRRRGCPSLAFSQPSSTHHRLDRGLRRPRCRGGRTAARRAVAVAGAVRASRLPQSAPSPRRRRPRRPRGPARAARPHARRRTPARGPNGLSIAHSAANVVVQARRSALAGGAVTRWRLAGARRVGADAAALAVGRALARRAPAPRPRTRGTAAPAARGAT